MTWQSGRRSLAERIERLTRSGSTLGDHLWVVITDGDFTSVLHGEPFRQALLL